MEPSNANEQYPFTKKQSDLPKQMPKKTELQLVPNNICAGAIMKHEQSQGSIQTTLAPRKMRNKSLKSRMRQITPPKAKKVEEIGIILNRVVRAKCCLQP